MGQSDFRCDDCGQTFSAANALGTHESTADCSKRSPCEACGDGCVETYCSPACSPDSVVCDECDKEFSTPQGLGSHRGLAHDTGISITCEGCGDEFTTKESRRNTARFCSYGCRAEWQADAYQGDGGPGWKGGKETYECRECGATIEQWSSQGGTEFCTSECYFAWLRENMPTGEDHWSYLDGERAYGRGWNDRKRRQVRERDGYECQDCGLTNEEHIDDLDAKLHVHHIQPHRTFDSDAEANRMENLVALCAYCHMSREADVWDTAASSPSPPSGSSQTTFDVWSSTGGRE